MASPYLTPERAGPRAEEPPRTEAIKTKEALYEAMRAMTQRLVARLGITCAALPALLTERPDDIRRWSQIVGARVGDLYGEEGRREVLESVRIERARLILIEGRDLEADARKNGQRIADFRAEVERMEASYLDARRRR